MANEEESAELRVLLGSDTDQQGYNIGGFLVDTSTWKKIPLAGLVSGGPEFSYTTLCK